VVKADRKQVIEKSEDIVLHRRELKDPKIEIRPREGKGGKAKKIKRNSQIKNEHLT